MVDGPLDCSLAAVNHTQNSAGSSKAHRKHCWPYLKGPPSGLRWRVTSSKWRPFLATNSASLMAALSTSGSSGAAGAALTVQHSSVPR